MQDQLPRLFGSRGNLQMPIDHEFGGQHTDLKLSIVESYLNGNPQGAAADGARCPIS
jgi:hypothetical protein